MSGISSTNARMEAGKSNIEGSERPWFDLSVSHLSGFCAEVSFYPKWNYNLILKHKTDDNYMKLVSIPSPQWEGDLLDEFSDYYVAQRFYEQEQTNVKA